MAGLLDFLQSASNASALTVSGPVDMLAWLLQKAGVPVGNAPPGGSAWMDQKGLTKPVKQSAASLAGETVGLLSPTVAAAKAPQIAKGLLQVADNAAAPRLMRDDKGAIVWHGSPHKFDKFDSSKIGTGEGAQAYGHGLYLAEKPDVAKSYSQAGDAAAPVVKNWLAEADSAGVPASMSYQWARNEIAKRLENTKIPGVKKTLGDALARFDEILGGGNLYKVDLPDNSIARMLDWDKTLHEHPNNVFGAVSNVYSVPGWQRGQRIPLSDVVKQYQSSGMQIDKIPESRITARQAYSDLVEQLGSSAAAANKLREAGIPGIRYLDGGSRGAGSGTSNFVVFPGEEGLLKILERNGQGL